MCDDGLARDTGAEVEGRGCVDGVLGLVTGPEQGGEGIFQGGPPIHIICIEIRV